MIVLLLLLAVFQEKNDPAFFKFYATSDCSFIMSNDSLYLHEFIKPEIRAYPFKLTTRTRDFVVVGDTVTTISTFNDKIILESHPILEPLGARQIVLANQNSFTNHSTYSRLVVDDSLLLLSEVCGHQELKLLNLIDLRTMSVIRIDTIDTRSVFKKNFFSLSRYSCEILSPQVILFKSHIETSESPSLFVYSVTIRNFYYWLDSYGPTGFWITDGGFNLTLKNGNVYFLKNIQAEPVYVGNIGAITEHYRIKGGYACIGSDEMSIVNERTFGRVIVDHGNILFVSDVRGPLDEFRGVLYEKNSILWKKIQPTSERVISTTIFYRTNRQFIYYFEQGQLRILDLLKK